MEDCLSTHNMTALSVFSATSSAFLLLTTVPLNALIIYCIGRRREKRRMFFYKLLLNIAVADLLKGTFGDISSVVWHIREAVGFGENYWKIDVRFVHISIFLPDGVALVSMTILSFDRIYALLAPYQNFRGCLKPQMENIIVFSTYPISALILTPYFITRLYIRQLVIFFSCTHTIAVISLILLTSIYRYKYKRPISKTSSFNESASGSITTSMTSLDNNGGSSYVNASSDEKEVRKRGLSLEETTTDNNLPEEEKKLKKLKLKRNTSAPVLSAKSSLDSNQVWSDLNDGPLKIHGEVVKNNKNTIEGEKYLCDADPQIITTTIEVNKTFPNSEHSFQSKQMQIIADQRKAKRSMSLVDADIFSHFKRDRSTGSRYSRTKTERRVTRTFMIMLVVFIVTYLPTCITVILMNTKEPHCRVIHVLRDISVLGILSSSFFRALNFILTLKHLKREIFQVLKLSRWLKNR